MTTTFTVTRVPKSSSSSADTRQRLVETAATLFADRGFDNVTVREICTTSSANVAAINYHFGDKAGLYRAVIALAISVMQETNELSQRAGEGLSPEDQVRTFVRVYVGRLKGDGPTAWVHRLMARELEHPTEALDLVMAQVLRPRLDYLGGVVASIMRLPQHDARVTRAALSLQALCLSAARRMPASFEKALGAIGDLDATVNHIAEYSLGGMRAMAAAQ